MHHAAGPKNAGRFRDDERRFFQNLSQRGIFLSGQEHQGVAGDDMMRLARAQKGFYLLERFFGGEGIDPAA